MKALIILSLIAISASAFSNEVITGEAAEKTFNELKAFEYSAGAITEFYEYRLINRHNQEIECQKETMIYKNSEHVEVSVETKFECVLK